MWGIYNHNHALDCLLFNRITVNGQTFVGSQEANKVPLTGFFTYSDDSNWFNNININNIRY